MSPLPANDSFGPHLVGYDGGLTRLTGDQYAAMRLVLRVLKGGEPEERERDPRLTTGQAAEVIGVSRRTLTRYLDNGAIPYERHGNGHRTLLLSDVMAYKEKRKARLDALDEMRMHAADAGLYDLDAADELFAYFEKGEGAEGRS